jgi:hypothetical protein
LPNDADTRHGPAEESIVILSRGDVRLLCLERHAFSLDEALLDRARAELLPDREVTEGGFQFGYLLGVQKDRRTHPACLDLVDVVRQRMLDKDEQSAFELSFLKLAVGVPPTEQEGPLFEGPHLDTHPGLTDSSELLRLLVNFSRSPRRFAYSECDRWWLSEQDISYGRTDFLPLHLPKQCAMRSVAIPGRTDSAVHALRFYASAVPHVGINEPPEQFLGSLERLAGVP